MKTLAVCKREFFSFFSNPLGFITLTCFLFVNGIVLWIILNVSNSPEAPYGAALRLFFGGQGNPFFWMLIFIFIPVITMRLFSEEIKSGSIEILMTSPVSETQIAVGKYLGVFLFYVFLWIPTLAYPLIIAEYSRIELGPIFTGYLGIILVGAAFIQIGMMCSILSKSQVSAGIMCFAVLIFLFLISILKIVINFDSISTILNYIDFIQWLDQFAKGIIDTRPVIFLCSITFGGLYINIKLLEMRKWI